MSAITVPAPAVHYPDDDGLPMSDDTVQFRWIFDLYGNLDVRFRADPDVFVAGNHLIYPVEGNNKVRQAPDVFVAFGRPKVDRGSYKVWDEGGVFPQVVFEVWSPSNRYPQMRKKFLFYQKYGAEEYYILYPEFPAHVDAWRREADRLVQVRNVSAWVSPRLGIRFGVDRGELTVHGPDGRAFRPAAEIVAEQQEAERRAEGERQRADAERAAAAAARDRADRLAAKLRELGLDPDAV